MKNVIVPVHNSPLTKTPGSATQPLDAHVTGLLDKSVDSAVWKLVEKAEPQFTPDGKKYLTFTILKSDITKYKLRKPRC